VLEKFLKFINGGGAVSSANRDSSSVSTISDTPEHTTQVSEKTLSIADGRPLWWQKSLDENFPHIPEFESRGDIQNPSADLRQKLSERVAKVSVKMPSSFELFRALNNPDVSTRKITDIAGRDPVFAAALLRTVNSAWFGLREQVSSLGRAIVLLGYNNVKALALQQSFSGKASQSVHHKELWVHSAVTAAVAAMLARKIPGQDPAQVSTVALLHDLGGILMDGADLESFGQKIQVPAKVVESLLGGLLATHWQLPEPICKAVEEYTWPVYFSEDQVQSLTDVQCRIVCLADYYANYFDFKDITSKFAPPPAYFAEFGLPDSPRDWLSSEQLTEIDKTRMVMESIF